MAHLSGRQQAVVHVKQAALLSGMTTMIVGMHCVAPAGADPRQTPAIFGKDLCGNLIEIRDPAVSQPATGEPA